MADFRRGNNRDGGSGARGPFRGRSDGGGFGGGRGGGFRGRGDARREGGFSRERRPLEMHDATCDKCKKQCQVPFRPTGGKPVYCSDCFRQNDSNNFAPRSNMSSNSSSQGISQEQFSQLNAKLDKILKILEMVEMEDVSDEDDDSEEDSENESEEDSDKEAS